MKRKPMGNRQSKKSYRGGQRIHKKNVISRPMRGGIRL